MCSDIESLFQKTKHVQSPIRIDNHNRNEITSNSCLKFHNYWNRNDDLVLVNNGSTVKIRLISSDIETIPSISNEFLNSDKYFLDHFHFHWSEDDFNGSEHVFDNLKYGMEIHFVHYNSKYTNFAEAANHADGLAVIAIFCTINETNNSHTESDSETQFDFSRFVTAISDLKTADDTKIILSTSECWPLFEKVFKQSAYSLYKGSLTTTPYSENVIWLLMEMPVKIPKQLIGQFRNLISTNSTPIRNNVRPIQNVKPEIFYDSRNFTNLINHNY